MSWYYTREAGNDGQVLTDEGTPPGVCITDVVQAGPLPMSVALEMIAYLADILTISEEDRAVHGDISPGDVFVDERGSVSLANFGPMRSRGRAPEGKPLFPASEVYGLGVVLHALLSTQSLGAIPRERDAHDDAIVDKLLAIDWTDLQRLPGRDSLIHFLCSMLAHSPTERPAPLDVANVLAEAGNKIGGDGVAAWAARRWGQAGIQEELPTVAEVLEAPAELGRVFNKTGQYSRRQSASAKGESTAFWSRDKINAMLDDGDDPLAGSQMFQRRDLQSMLARDEDSAIRHIPARQQREPGAPAPWNPDSTISGRPEDPELARAMADLKRQAATNTAPPPPLPPSPPAPAPTPRAAPSSPTASPPVARPAVTAPPPKRLPPEKPFPWLPVVIGAVGFGLVLGMLALAAAIYYSSQSAPEGASTPAPPVEEEVAAPTEEAQPKAAPEPQAKPKPRKSTRKASTSSTRVKSAKRAKARAKPAPAPLPTGEFDVAFRAMGAEAEFVCGDGQSGRFIGMTRRKFSDVTTCRVTIDGKVGAVQVKRESTVSCSVSGAAVVCTGT